MEMKWGYRIFERAASELMPEVSRDFLDFIDNIIVNTSSNILPLISCFSLSGDVLSQWRAYAGDGIGYCIGFDGEHMANMAVRPLRVLYNEIEQITEVKSLIRALHELETEDNHKRGADFIEACQNLAIDIASLKNPAFSEEMEIRLVHAVNFKRENNIVKIKSVGGTNWGRDFSPPSVEFRFRREIPCPFVSIPFHNRQESPIKEIILGPRNEALETGVEAYLSTIGYEGFQIRKSKASYVSI
ncbi:MAG: DUF2971 domain-containing protein [Methylobacterium sp.]|nr:DUF2971 domain-containing protein [Methylobacterium sp.]MCA3605892.1 DUF2971 domain-containing protein [Methylobacterium sp.]MCA3609205.1 DUF2971 domain-containing protein [Methylobacterium sp.]MCA3610809.1 DUF2971 domain-containing protein [Methylobacterium sp.]MCA3618966.1 DUF2971 domain-containing protein [Methylobacterium sp.]